MRPKLPKKEKGTTQLFRLEIVFAPDVPLEVDGKPFLVHTNPAHYVGHPKRRTTTTQVYYYNFAPVRFLDPMADRTSVRESMVRVECLDYTGIVMEHESSGMLGRKVPAIQRKYDIGKHNIDFYWFFLRATPYNGPFAWGPGHSIDLMDYVGGDGEGWDNTEARRLAGRLREEMLPALGRIPSQEEYRQTFIVGLSISDSEAEALYQTREQVGLP